MVVIALNNAPPRLRGILSRWCLEVRANLFVARLDARMRDKLWEKITDMMEDDGTAVMCWSRSSVQGFSFLTLGENPRLPIERDGIWLVVHGKNHV